jgi:hypothetical protein
MTSLRILFLLALLWPGLGYPQSRIVSRFFQAPNTWYEKLTPANTVVDPNSAAMVAYLTSITGKFGTSTGGWSHPIFYAESTTPLSTVTISGNATAQQLGWDKVPIPPNAVQSSQTDGHLIVIDHLHHYAWELYQARKISSTAWAASRMRRWDLTGDGVQSPSDRLGAVRQCPVPLLHGLITYEEMQRGLIDHAIEMTAYSQGDNFWAPYPGEINLSGQDQINKQSGIEACMRLQLDPALDLNTLSLPPLGKVVAKAMQEYGVFIVDGSERRSTDVQFENLDARPDGIRWGSTLSGILYNIPKAKLRVVASPLPVNQPPATRVQTTQQIPILEGNPLAPQPERFQIPAGVKGTVQSIPITKEGQLWWFVNFDDPSPFDHWHSWVKRESLTLVSGPPVLPPVIPPVEPPVVTPPIVIPPAGVPCVTTLEATAPVTLKTVCQ